MPLDRISGPSSSGGRAPGKHILPQIDGLRGLAIAAVIYQHGFSHGVGDALAAKGVFPYLQSNAWMALALFFILSGFVLALPFVGAADKIRDWSQARAFHARRARRLLPLFALGCFIGFLVNRTEPQSLFDALTTISMFNANEFFPKVNGPFWSLILEIWFSIFLPLLIIAGWRFGFWRVLAAAMLVGLATRIIATRFSLGGLQIDLVKDSVPGRIDDFVIGIVVAKLYVDGQLRQVPRWLAYCGAALVLLSALSWDLIVQGVVPAPARAFLNIPTSVGFACILMACLAERSRLTGVLSWWPLRVAGAMCFSLYCWHHWIMEATNPNSLAIKPMAQFLLLTIVVALLSYKFIEFPQASWRSLLRLDGFALRPGTRTSASIPN